MSEDRAEGLDLDALKAVAQAAAEDAGGPWFATGRGAYVCSDPVEEDKIYRDGDGPIKGWLASADTTEIAKHMATFDPPTVLKLIALAQHDQARPGVEGWKTVPVEPTEAMLDAGLTAEAAVLGRLVMPTGAARARYIEIGTIAYRAMLAAAPALPTTIRGGREEIAAIERLRRVADGEPEYAVYPGPPTPRRKAIRSDLRAVLALPASIGVGKEGLGADLSQLQPAESGTGPLPHANKEAVGDWRCTRCGRDEIDARANGCTRGPCPMVPR